MHGCAKQSSSGSFGDKGERVIAALQPNTGKHHAGHVRMMEHHLFNEVQPRRRTS